MKEALSGFLTLNDSSNAKGLPTKPNHHSLLSQEFTPKGIVLEKLPFETKDATHLSCSFRFATKKKIARLGNVSACNYYVSFIIASIVCLDDWLITLKTLEQLLFYQNSEIKKT